MVYWKIGILHKNSMQFLIMTIFPMIHVTILINTPAFSLNNV